MKDKQARQDIESLRLSLELLERNMARRCGDIGFIDCPVCNERTPSVKRPVNIETGEVMNWSADPCWKNQGEKVMTVCLRCGRKLKSETTLIWNEWIPPSTAKK